MIKVAIVENDEKTMSAICGYIQAFQKENKYHLRVDRFFNALDFISDYRMSYDIVFVSVELKMMTGVELAQKLRNCDRDALIVLLSVSDAAAVLGYRISAFDYLKKPIGQGELTSCLYRAIATILERPAAEQMLWIDGTVKRLTLKDIRYVEVLKHYITYHVLSNRTEEERTYTVKGQLIDIEEKFCRNGFYRLNKSYLVNMDYITQVSKDSIFLDKQELSIARRRRSDFRIAFYNYISGRI